jgi:hypothetical protein
MVAKVVLPVFSFKGSLLIIITEAGRGRISVNTEKSDKRDLIPRYSALLVSGQSLHFIAAGIGMMGGAGAFCSKILAEKTGNAKIKDVTLRFFSMGDTRMF